MIGRTVSALLDYEEMFLIPNIDWDERRSVSELWALRDALKVQKTLLDDFDGVVDLITTTIGEVLFRVIHATPSLPDSAAVAGSITVPTRKARPDRQFRWGRRSGYGVLL